MKNAESSQSNPERITVRRPIAAIRKETPKHWLGGDMFKTYLANTLTILFPDTEEYFIRTTKKFLPSISNPKLKKDVLSFIGQEAQHSKIHHKTWTILESQGFEIRGFLKYFNTLSFGIIEKFLTPKINLSVVAGLEHFTTILAELILENNLMKDADPVMKDIFEWHCAEELEHKHVAFDLLKYQEDRYDLRFLGYIIASALVLGYSLQGILYLAIQGDLKHWQRFINEAKDFLIKRDKAFPKGFSKYLDYLHPDFHPNQKDTRDLIFNVIVNMQFEPILNTKSANTEHENNKRTSFN
ncbi:MAG: metal-dependent hydrolase [Leptospira sp.]|nr:metal-dependent hydrolase [Leptospira sp.]